jgi:TolB-like protein/Flp pilus assembly protein TadD
MATGQRPFREEPTPRLTDAILHRVPEPPSSCNPRLSPALENIILKALDKEPERRHQSARDLLADFLRLSAPSAAVLPARAHPRYGRWVRVAGLAIVLLLVVLLGLSIEIVRDRILGRARASQIRSLAVLPLENLSGDSQQEYFVDGMTDELTNELAKISGLEVRSRNSAMRFKSTTKSSPEIGRDLKVDGLLAGSAKRWEGKVHITVQLIHAASDKVLWVQSYDREEPNVPMLHSEVARDIADQVKIELTPQEHRRLATSRPVDAAAYEAYLKGKYLSKGTYEQRKKAREYFEQTVRMDPNYAPGYAGLADSYWATPDLPAQEAMPKAKEYALKALAIDDTLAHAHRALASIRFYGDWHWVAAEREFKRALELNSNDAETHSMYSVYLSAMQRFEEAVTEARAAQELDPLSVSTNITVGWTLYCARQYDRAAEQCQKALELAPNSDGAHACLGYSYLGKGMYEQAIVEFKKAFTFSGGDAVRAVWLGRAYAEAGKETDARKVLSELHHLSKRTYVSPYFLATLHVALGDKKQAFAWLERAYAERDLYLAWLKMDQAVDPLRSEPRFQDLLQRVGLSP